MVEPPSFGECLSMLESNDVDQQQQAIACLSQSDDPQALDVLLSLIDDPRVNIVDTMLYALGALGEKLRQTQQVERVLHALIFYLHYAHPHDYDGVLQETAIYTLGIFGEKIKQTYPLQRVYTALMTFLDHTNPTLRCRAITALGRAGDQSVVMPLIESLTDTSPTARVCAAEALGWLQDSRAVPLLLQTLHDPEPLVRSGCLTALAQMPASKLIVDHVIALLHDQDAYVRQSAVEALGSLGDPAAFEAIWNYVRIEHTLKPAQAAWAAAMLGAAVFAKLIALARTDADPDTRYWAATALKNNLAISGLLLIWMPWLMIRHLQEQEYR